MTSKRSSTDAETTDGPPSKVLRTDGSANDDIKVEINQDQSSVITMDSAESEMILAASKHVEALGATIGTLSKKLREERQISANAASEVKKDNANLQTRVGELGVTLVLKGIDHHA